MLSRGHPDARRFREQSRSSPKQPLQTILTSPFDGVLSNDAFEATRSHSDRKALSVLANTRSLPPG
jgi:hypothetical protein